MALFFRKPVLEDDNKEPLAPLIEHRLPWLTIGLLGGILTTFLASKFESLLSTHIQLVFFIPVIVYMADAVGTQTETIYIRSLAREKVNLYTYLVKETLIGVSLGILFGIMLGFFAYFWLQSLTTALTVALAMFINVAIAPVTALLIPSILQKERTDPALGSGPFTTILQDLISLLVYFLIAAVILLGS